MVQRGSLAQSASSRHIFVASLSVAVIGLLRRRGRSCVVKLAALAREMVKSGRMIDNDDAQQIVTISMSRASELPFVYDNSAKPLACQVGGISETKSPVLEMPPIYVLKPLHVDHRGYREIAFYESIKSASSGERYVNATFGEFSKISVVGAIDTVARRVACMLGDSVASKYEEEITQCFLQWKQEVDLLRELSTFTPKYYGVMGPEESRQRIHNHYIVLHDMTARFRKPCVIDIKMGSQTYEPDATEEKSSREYIKYPHQKDFCFRIVGMRMYDPRHPEADPDGFRFFPKDFGRSLTCMESQREAFQCFFTSNLNPCSARQSSSSGELANIDSTSNLLRDAELRVNAISNLISELERLDAWFKHNGCLRFYSSSILMVYEGEYSLEGGASDMTALKMIDFGHVRRDPINDDGYRVGLRSLIRLFGELLNEGMIKCANAQYPS